MLIILIIHPNFDIMEYNVFVVLHVGSYHLYLFVLFSRGSTIAYMQYITLHLYCYIVYLYNIDAVLFFRYLRTFVFTAYKL